MKDLTVKWLYEGLTETLKGIISRDTEAVHYIIDTANRKMRCQLHMKNGFIVEGSAVMLNAGFTSLAKEVSRKDALQKLITVVQYNLATKLHDDAVLESLNKRLDKTQ